ncbi:MAG: ATP-binding protein [Andreesenia angusta]|nr:ATP-binding protein [Andreesenia angusta]
MNDILREYKLKQTRAIEEARQRREEIYKELPEVKEIDKKFKKLGLKISMAALDSKVDPNKVRLKISELNNKKIKLLKSKNYKLEDFEPKYECNICKDEGYTEDGERCTCLKNEIIKKLYLDSNLKNLLEKENFSTTKFDIFSEESDDPDRLSPRETIIEYFVIAYDFCNDAKKNDIPTSNKNLLLFGATGLGKTFLTNCIAKEFLDSGLSVIYLVAFQLFDIISDHRFTNDSRRIDITKEKYDSIFNCDLLIIDDLGTELTNSFTISELYNVINLRIINDKRTIISTNLNPKELSEIYTDRIFSRISAYYKQLYFFGDDLRWESNKHSKKSMEEQESSFLNDKNKK